MDLRHSHVDGCKAKQVNHLKSLSFEFGIFCHILELFLVIFNYAHTYMVFFRPCQVMWVNHLKEVDFLRHCQQLSSPVAVGLSLLSFYEVSLVIVG